MTVTQQDTKVLAFAELHHGSRNSKWICRVF